MGRILTNNEIEIGRLNRVIPFCKTRKEALEIQDEILRLEEIESEVCPECGNYEKDPHDDEFTCTNDYHDNE